MRGFIPWGEYRPPSLKGLLLLKAAMPKCPKQIGGIPIGVDNAAYISGGKADNYAEDENWFLTPPLDTGDSTSKAITYYRGNGLSANDKAPSVRFFNDLTGNNVDFFSVYSQTPSPRTVTIAARYVIYPVFKANAADCYVYYTLNGEKHYLCKGTNVTE